MRNNLITRKMKYYNLIIILLIMFSCTNKEVVLDNGVSIKYFKNGIGDVVKNDEFIMLNIQYFDYEGNEELTLKSQ